MRAEDEAQTSRRPLLSVVVPVYNGGDEIVENVAIRASAVTADLQEPGRRDHRRLGRLDRRDRRKLLAARDDIGMRVIHYDRNLGKGYAVKLGSLARSESGSPSSTAISTSIRRHPPTSRRRAGRTSTSRSARSVIRTRSSTTRGRAGSRAGCYQQLNRILFRLDVRDTQVGLKVFRGEVADEVVPLLLVKQFAFDLELLAVGRALGYVRMKEMPIRLDYRFTGSAVRSRAVVRALVDTLAIFYRLRVLRTYQRKRALIGAHGRVPESPPLVTLIDGESVAASLDYPRLEGAVGGDREAAARAARGELLALLAAGALPAGNWVTASVPYFADTDVAAVVAPTVSPQDTGFRECVAAAVLESRLGGGSRRSRFLPGNVGTVSDYPLDAVVVRRPDYVDAREAGVDDGDLIAWLGERGRRTIYTPDTSISAPPPPIVAPHLRATVRQARSRGLAARASRGSSLSAATALSVVPLVAGIVAIGLVLIGGVARTVGLVVLAAYGIGLVLTAIFAAFRLRSIGVGLLTPIVVIPTQAVYVVGFARGLFDSRRARRSVVSDSASTREA